jgi:2-isopropylmalate synthase
MDADSIGIHIFIKLLYKSWFILLFHAGLANNNLVLGKHSGRAAFRSRLTELGYSLTDDELNRSFIRFKELADKKKEISNADIESLVNDEVVTNAETRYCLTRIQVQCGDQQVATATATIRDDQDNREVTTACVGTGPVDAAFKAIRQQIPNTDNFKLLEYTVSSVTAGIDALGEVTVRLQDTQNGLTVLGRASSTDVIVASAQAYVNAINRLVQMQGRKVPLHPQFNSM